MNKLPIQTYESVVQQRDELEKKLADVVAENTKMRNAIEFATAPDMWIEQHDGMLEYRYVDWYVDVLNEAKETPATEAFTREMMARGVEAFAKDWKGAASYSRISEMACNFAAKLRNGDADEC
ncbi:hypothetical protein [Hafnia alvei]|uniref:hypothetical protein n=1 Tax=Hafnia alvei TaxID=569 RepID=UPI000E01002B|nr:hypothetical protein [Hafnia alvei]STQ67879.1 Uncharacterised protein [Hafnia alvei]